MLHRVVAYKEMRNEDEVHARGRASDFSHVELLTKESFKTHFSRNSKKKKTNLKLNHKQGNIL